MDITLYHPSGEVEYFPIEEDSMVRDLYAYVDKTYKYFKLMSSGVELENLDACFSTLESNEVIIGEYSICGDCDAWGLTEGAARFAARNGHLECLKYLLKNDCPWNEYTTWSAENSGHLECLKYLLENNCP